MSTGADGRLLVLVAAGGTGGHLFPAEALAAALAERGVRVALATDSRAARYGGHFPADAVHVVPSATVRGRDPLSLARTAGTLALGLARAYALLGRLKPAMVVGFGGYPTVPPVLAATLRRIPALIHEQNGVMGRANRLLASRVQVIATGFAGVTDHDAALKAKTVCTGNPVRPAVVAAAAVPYDPPSSDGAFRLLVFGGSQGARVMSEIVPPAVARLEPHLQMRLRIVQQARAEDAAHVRGAFMPPLGSQPMSPRSSPIFPRVWPRSHLIVSRSGASTVAELAAIGRPAILVPLPHALDQDQNANAMVLEKAGGAIRLPQAEFSPDRLAAEIAALAGDPARLSAMAVAAKSVGVLDAAGRLADLVLRTAGARPH
ncbi:MAG: UDP-N-acetylglucosamine--N-acetylmuramyl-(pentapeptide) pyrophosphoryl-undecaprenol N-acetylglucosamine transferase [Pseudorhodoplanes sp.]|nr:UDP-N-acetylglucosamine--N-acetylmuramyl-(pentapeptide) pyrophosphoryl-undecaprenol N-acetylglucosamine transferase [Pseudorhodoplanes sp.]